MGVNEDIFENKVKVAFSKVKDHISGIETNIKTGKDELTRLKEEALGLKKEVELLRNELRLLMESQKPKEPQTEGFKEVSSGNEGVYSFTHSFTKHSFNSYAHNIQGFKQDFDKIFGGLSQQEFLTFLTIYQLEEEFKQVSYIEVAKKLNLTEGCIRTYVSSLLKKGLPLIKRKYNNKQVFLQISPEFKSLNLKQKLIDTFYHCDPTQRTLQEPF